MKPELQREDLTEYIYGFHEISKKKTKKKIFESLKRKLPRIFGQITTLIIFKNFFYYIIYYSEFRYRKSSLVRK